MLNYELIKKCLFQLDPELAHNSTLALASRFPQLLNTLIPSSMSGPIPVKGKTLHWNFPIGLAAGLDKNADALDYWQYLGFGSIEIGTVTLKPQMGNEFPRMFRYPSQQSIRNSMGFPSLGMNHVLERIKSFKKHSISVGVNLGKNKNSTLEESIFEYKILYDTFSPYADYLVINLSSPNTKGLRQFQNKESLKMILSHLSPFSKPLFIKLSPDESLDTYENIFQIAHDFNLAGIITTNTTIDHPFDKGGYSGVPLFEKNKKNYFKFIEWSQNTNLDLILCGGISKKEDLYPYIEKGQNFFQIYTSFVYQGPKILSELEQAFRTSL